ncbi:hypothetical protein HY086_01930 [Candidatus Gottesmanbacteria bacterium]|nr:hypothetical protein [Candidatus Gottesmanbacteria bacterium]
MKYRWFFEIIIVVALSLPIVLPLVSPGFFSMHDDTQVGRVVAMGKALKDGQFPVRWVSDLGYGYGYPIFNFYGPLPYYVGGSLYVLGLDGLTATKIMLAIGMLLPSVTMFLFVRSITGFLPALVASVLYAYAPYHAVQLYVRGAVGELWTLIFYPLLALGAFRKSVFWGSIGLAGTILSHTLLGFATIPFLIIAFFLKRLPLSILLLGLGLSAFFWLPAIAEMKFTDVAGQVSTTANFRDHFVCLPQLWDSVWGFGGSVAGCIDGLSFRLGKLSILLSAVAIFLLLFKKPVTRIRSIGWLGFVVAVGSLFLALPISQHVWELSPYFAYLQYPWRFLATAAFGMSLLGAMVFATLRPERIADLFALLTIGILLFINGKLFQPQYIINRPTRAFETNEELRWRVSKISDEYLPPGLAKPTSQSQLPQGVVVDSGTSFSYQLTSTSSAEVIINKAYFPGWRYWVNGVNLQPKISGGLPVLAVPKGQNSISAQLTNTPVRTLGNVVSLVSLLVFGGYLWQKNRP